MAVASARSRYGGSKVRTGCVTCKARHVKCGEERPHCTRCINAGRECGGYVKPGKRTRKTGDSLVLVHYVPKVTVAPQSTFNLNPQERRAFDIFQQRALPEISGNFCGDAWSTSLLILVHHEQAIRHAVIALGSLYDHGGLLDLCAPEETLDFALEQYGQAIQQVVKLDVTESKQAVDVALMACLLFTCFESMQGHCYSALTHILSGLKVLAERKTRPPKKDEHYVALEVFEEMFARLDTQVVENDGACDRQVKIKLGRTTSRHRIPQEFLSVHAAMTAMDEIANELRHLDSYADRMPGMQLNRDGEEDVKLLHKQDRVAARFTDWCFAFDKMMVAKSRTNPSKAAADIPAVLCLQMFKLTTEIMLNVDQSLGEVDFDRFLPQFREITSCGAEFVELCTSTGRNSRSRSRSRARSGSLGSTTSSCQSTEASFFLEIDGRSAHGRNASLPSSCTTPVFTLSRGIITPLYLVSARCRDPQTRYRALHLLQICNRKEGIWDSRHAARIAQRIIDIEQQGAADLLMHEVSYSIPHIVSASQIADCVRIGGLELLYSGPASTGRIRYTRPAASLHDVLEWPKSTSMMSEEYLGLDDSETLHLEQLSMAVPPCSTSEQALFDEHDMLEDHAILEELPMFEEQGFPSLDHSDSGMSEVCTSTMLWTSGLRIRSMFADWPILVDSAD